MAGVRRTTSSPAHLVAGNLLIAAGTIVLSASGTLAGRLGKDTAFAVTLLIGIVVLFAGFLVARRPTGATVARRYISERRSSLPLTLRGSSSTNRIFDGHL